MRISLLRISLLRFFKTITKILLMRFYGLFILLLRHKIKILLMQLFSVHKSSIRTLCMLIWCRSKFNVKNDNVDFDLATYYCYFFFAYKSVLFFLVMAQQHFQVKPAALKTNDNSISALSLNFSSSAYSQNNSENAKDIVCKAMKSIPLLGPFCGSEFWRFSQLKI